MTWRRGVVGSDTTVKALLMGSEVIGETSYLQFDIATI
jgi:hypothetical protein